MGIVSDALQDSSRVGTGWGFAVMILGVLAIMTPFVTGVAVTVLLAVLLTAAGLTITMYAFKAGSFGKGALQFLFGGITILCGLSMFFTPVESMMTLTIVLLAYFFIDGIFAIFAGFTAKPATGWGWIVISGVSSIVLAVLLWSKWPVTGAYAIGILLGIRLIFTGWSIAMLGAVGDRVSDELKSATDG
jgi:uncharacterized membrane protein HdeD (DUF308 family)